jgi:hypothetical protein
MNQTIHAHHVEKAYNYNTAVRRWQKADPVSKRDDPTIRRMGTASQNNISIRHDGAGGPVYYRYHGTDIVTYHPNGAIQLKPWNSRSTDALCRAILPNSISTNYMSPAGLLVIVSAFGEIVPWWMSWEGTGTVYDVRTDVFCVPNTDSTDPDVLRNWDKGWCVLPEVDGRRYTRDFQWPIVNQKLLRETYKAAGYPAFREWVMARRAFPPGPKESLAAAQVPQYLGDDAWLRARLKDKQYEMLWTYWTQWRGPRATTTAEALCDVLREILIKQVPEAITVSLRPWLTPAELDAYIRATKTYGWVLR